MSDESSILWGMLFGSIGIGFFMYGRRQRRIVPFVSGCALFVIPYFVDGTLAMVALCVAFIALPYFIRS